MMPLRGAAERRVFLFLQGPASTLFAKIGRELAAAGNQCLRLNLNAGDWLFWRGAGATFYRGRLEDWPEYLTSFFSTNGVTDILLLGEERPYHKIAVELAKARGILVTVIEMGYLRPDWITVERNGISSNSHFPADPEQIRQAARDIPQPDFTQIYTQSFVIEAVLDLVYNLPNVFLAWVFPHYRRHALFHPVKEYAGWIRRLLTSLREKAIANKVMEWLEAQRLRYFVYPLQLETDYQLRAHSPYSSQFEAIEEVLTSFVKHSPPETHLVIKAHPLDNGLLDWKGRVASIAAQYGVTSRIHYIASGDLARLIKNCSGMVAVNSTAVLHGLKSGIPAKVLGCAIYDVDGMTHQGVLNSFWCDPAMPDLVLTLDFYKLLAEAIHVRGNFSSSKGTASAAKAIASRLLEGRINMPGGDCGYAPRAKPLKFQLRLNVSNGAHEATKGC